MQKKIDLDKYVDFTLKWELASLRSQSLSLVKKMYNEREGACAIYGNRPDGGRDTLMQKQ